MAIEIQQENVDGTHVLALGGRLDTETSADVELALQDLMNAGESHFLIDMSGIGYVSSAGLRVLLATAKQLEGGKGTLRLCSLNANVKQVFDVAGFSRLFSIFPNRDSALGAAPKVKKTEKPESPKPAPKAAAAPVPKVEAAKPAPPKPPAPPVAPPPPKLPPAPAAPKAEALGADVVLAQKIASLWGLKLIDHTPHSTAVELARLAAELLGVKSVIAGGILPKPQRVLAPPPAEPPPVATPRETPPDDAPKGGMMGKLRGLFGGKR